MECDGTVKPFNSEKYMAAARSESEYTTQFLGFAPRGFCDGLYNAILELTWEYFQSSQEYIKCEFTDVIKKEEMQRAAEVFLPAISKAIDKAFDKFETYVLTNILCVPSNVVLAGDQVQMEYKDFSKEEEDLLDMEIVKLKERITAVKYVNASLRAEFKQMEVVQQKYKQFLVVLEQMENTLKRSEMSNPRDSVVFAVQKSNELIGLLSQINQKMAEEKGQDLKAINLEEWKQQINIK